jgi:TolB protein
MPASGSAKVALALPELEPAHPEARSIASDISRIVFDDISFASAFKIVDPSTYALARRASDPYYGWESIGADLAITGIVAKPSDELAVEIRIHAVREREVVFESRYAGGRASSRELAHYVSDSILQKFGVAGVARTRIAFASDRDDGRKALYIADYDGFDQRRGTQHHHLDFQPRFSPDGSAMSYISFPAKNRPPVLAILNHEPVFDGPGMIFSASWSPDGDEIAFAATRDEPGNSEIYVMRRDGTNIRRLTHHPAIDVSPTWSPTGRRIAFTSDRTGSPQIYSMDAEGLDLKRISMKGSYNAEPAWSPLAGVNEIAYASRFSGGVFDIVVHSLVTNEVRFLTSNQGLNESPQWSPNGRHIVFTSTRTGTPQIFTMNRDGTNQRQITFEGGNTTPSWSPPPGN